MRTRSRRGKRDMRGERENGRQTRTRSRREETRMRMRSRQAKKGYERGKRDRKTNEDEKQTRGLRGERDEWMMVGRH